MSNTPENQHWLQRSANRQTFRHGRPSALEQSREDSLADWVGDDRRASIFADLRPEAPAMSSLVQEVITSLHDPAVVLLQKLQSSWADLVGDSIAGQSHPSRIWRKTLRIEVHSAPWLYILSSQHRNTILERVRAFSAGVITDIQFTPPGIQPASTSSAINKGQP